ncbi:MAG: MotA/TolQ/ExbB proton channel family protein [Phycisphaerae bacterium]|nr:MotA/TolQ/ExbB proton channel family protein [Phycisphaerae bacterium]
MQHPSLTLTSLLAADGPSAPSFSSIFFWSSSASGGIDWIGSGLIWFLIALSVVNVWLIGRFWIAERSDDIAPASALEHVRSLVLAERYREAIDATRNGQSDVSRMLFAAFDAAPGGDDAMVAAFFAAADDARTTRIRSLERLNVLGQISPMIGLFGTVYGMIVAFQTIAASGGAADPVLLAGGIGTALVTTFWGLFIAIPALAAYAALRARTEKSLDDAERGAESILALFRAKHRG